MMLYLTAVLCGAAAGWSFLRWTDRDGLKLAAQRIAGHWLEIRLYFDDPRVVWGAQQALLRWHWRMLRSVGLALALSAGLMIGAFFAMDATYSTGRGTVMEEIVVTTKGLQPTAGYHFEADASTSYKVAVARTLPVERPWLLPFSLTWTLATCAIFLLL